MSLGTITEIFQFSEKSYQSVNYTSQLTVTYSQCLQ